MEKTTTGTAAFKKGRHYSPSSAGPAKIVRLCVRLRDSVCAKTYLCKVCMVSLETLIPDNKSRRQTNTAGSACGVTVCVCVCVTC